MQKLKSVGVIKCFSTTRMLIITIKEGVAEFSKHNTEGNSKGTEEINDVSFMTF